MSKTHWLIVIGVGIVSQVGAIFFGLQFKEALLAGLLIAWAIGAILVWRGEKRFISEFKAGTDDYRLRVLELLGPDAKPFLHKVHGTFHHDWWWAAANVLAAGLLIVGLPLTYSIATENNLSWDAPLTLWHLLLMVAGFGIWTVNRRWRARSYRCRSCGLTLAPIANDKLQFECLACGILWYVLDQRKWV